MKYKIEYVAFTATATAPGILNSESTLADAKYPGIDMEYDTEAALLTAKLPKTTKVVLIPGSNIKSMVGTLALNSVTPQVKKP